MSVLALLSADNFITVNRTVMEIVGLEAAVIFGELASESLYWSNRDPDYDGFFYSTVENVESRTTLSAYNQRVALQKLQEAGWVEVISKKGIPPKRYIRINEDAVIEAVNIQKSKNLTFVGKNSQLSKVENFNTNKNITKKNKEKEKDYIQEILSGRLFSEQLTTALRDFIDMRKKVKKPVTDRAMQMLVKKAYELANNNEQDVIEIFNQSTQHSWIGIYPIPIKNSTGGTNSNPFVDLLNRMEDE